MSDNKHRVCPQCGSTNWYFVKTLTQVEPEAERPGQYEHDKNAGVECAECAFEGFVDQLTWADIPEPAELQSLPLAEDEPDYAGRIEEEKTN